MFSLPLSGRSINATCRGRIVGMRSETKWHILGLPIRAAHLLHRCAHEFIYARLAEIMLHAAAIDHLINTDTSGILLTSFTLHNNLLYS